MALYQFDFTIKDPSPWDMTGRTLVQRGASFGLDLAKDSRTLSIHGIDAQDENAAYPIARQLVEDFLNHLCAQQHFCTKVVPGYGYKNLTTGKGGYIIQPKALVLWFERQIPQEFRLHLDWNTAAYWRKAQISDDVFERFRNYYLIVDCVGKRIRGVEKPDRTVLKDTVACVAGSELPKLHSQLSKVLLSPPLTCTGSPEDDLNAVLYEAYRCSLMHAGRPTEDRVPFNLKHEQEVTSALDLMEWVARLYREYEQGFTLLFNVVLFGLPMPGMTELARPCVRRA